MKYNVNCLALSLCLLALVCCHTSQASDDNNNKDWVYSFVSYFARPVTDELKKTNENLKRIEDIGTRATDFPSLVNAGTAGGINYNLIKYASRNPNPRTAAVCLGGVVVTTGISGLYHDSRLEKIQKNQ